MTRCEALKCVLQYLNYTKDLVTTYSFTQSYLSQVSGSG